MRFNRSLLSILLFLVLGSALSGCAFGNRHTYRDVQFTVPETKGIEIALVTHDTRPYVISKNKPPSFVGLQRGGYGNPFDVLNSKGEALSTSFTYAICHSIQRSGGKCVEVQTGPGEPNIEVQRRLAETGLPHGVLLTLSEWKTDTYQNTSLQ